MTWFTKEEKRALIFIFVCLFLGIFSSFCFKNRLLEKRTPLSREEKELIYPQVDINSANFSQLLALPGIGPSLAEAILEYRKENGPFKEINQLLKIKGIGSQKLQEISKYIIIK